MSIELTLLAWTLVLAVIQIMLPAASRTKEVGLAHNAGPRDVETVPVGRITGRLKRAQANLFETLPLFAAAILIAHVAGGEGMLTLCGAWLYLSARIVYIPLYAFGVPYIRSAAWAVSLLGLVFVLLSIL